jgi:hypothetical protein
MRIALYIWLRNLALRVYGYEHFGGKFDGDYMTVYAKRRRSR